MSAIIDQTVEELRTALPPVFAGMSLDERTGDPNIKNPNSTARGLVQMIESTRNMVLKEIRDITEAAREEERTFQDRRTAIFEEYRAWKHGGKDPSDLERIVEKVRDFNTAVDRMDRPNISPITRQSLESQLVTMESPSRKELGRVGIGEADAVRHLTAKDFEVAEQRAAFKVQAKRINDLIATLDEMKRAHNPAAAQFVRDNNITAQVGPLRRTETDLRRLSADRDRLDRVQGLPEAQRQIWTQKYDAREQQIYQQFSRWMERAGCPIAVGK